MPVEFHVTEAENYQINELTSNGKNISFQENAFLTRKHSSGMRTAHL